MSRKKGNTNGKKSWSAKEEKFFEETKSDRAEGEEAESGSYQKGRRCVRNRACNKYTLRVGEREKAWCIIRGGGISSHGERF